MRIVIGTWIELPALEPDAVYINTRHRAVLRGRSWPVSLSGHQTAILAAVSAAGAAPVAHLVEQLYGDDSDGGPDNAGQIVGQLVHTLNKKIAPLGLRVRGRKGWGYELMDLRA